MRRLPHEHPLFSRVTSPAELRRLPRERLPALAEELRQCLADHVSMPSGMLGPSLRVVELAVALHYVYKTPQDRLVWDGGQATYAHKMLTGRRPRLHAARQKGQLVARGRGESRYDELGAAHAGSAISVALGISSASAAQGERGRVVAVIGARALASGMAFEALNHAGSLPRDLLVILNDTDASFVRGAGALSAQFARAFSGNLYGQLRARGKRMLSQMPTMRELARRSEKHIKGMVLPGSLFEEMGFHYTGPFDGSDVIGLVRTLQNLQKQAGPQFLHVVTPAAKSQRRPLQVRHESPVARGFARSFGEWACETAGCEPRLVCISTDPAAAVGLESFAQRFPERYFEATGSEQHAVTLAAGLATEGQRPVLALRAGQLPRVYDQLIHDVVLQNLPVLFAASDAGLSGTERSGEHSPCDLSFLRCIPGLTLAVPADQDECRQMLSLATQLKGPAVVRFPGGEAAGVPQPQPLACGRGTMVREGGSGLGLLVFGTLLEAARQAAERLDATLINMRFVKPLDETLLVAVAAQCQALVTIEENVVAGGAGSAVAEWLHARRHPLPVLHLGIPPGSFSGGSRAQCLEAAGLDANGLTAGIERWLALRAGARRQAAGG
jgi:1-deoxy-D-xylulose-5-phosphate synthase